MDFAETRPEGVLSAEYGSEGRLNIGGCEYAHPVGLTGTDCFTLAEDSPLQCSADSFAPYFDRYGRPEVILLGTGSRQIFPNPQTVAALAAQGIGLEAMSTPAACRTLLLLQSEGRRVWAWLWP
ncbi:Mth938-like domain-containing protein [Neisseria leonii]|uniref:Mth938-like domain-containing protein n=1 Tax=Neisseria leonii TaxID=2995413 RepID=A0A9X4E2M2_9NEIS|nr:Mth938-like domain-containing protein [Neisseria sp. 51.81]MDD9328323.1 Mth938-like domain-containing protein [Neisseria sp. 51.81]